MTRFALLLFTLWQLVVTAQDTNLYEKPPVFPECQSEDIANLKTCFFNQLATHIYNNFKVPTIVEDENYTGNLVVLFEVDTEGNFVVLYVDAIYEELKTSAQLVFSELPKIQPATYNGNPTYKQYSYTIEIPLVDPFSQTVGSELEEQPINEIERARTEYDSVTKSLVPFTNKELSSQLNIPFTHQYYSKFDKNLNVVGNNMHTASKPFVYDEVARYYSFDAEREALKGKGESWAKRKLVNEHLVQIQSKDYWFTLDPIFDFQVGNDSESTFSTTYNNTRGVYIQGGVGKKFNFMTAFFESQGRFATYFNDYAESIRPEGSDPAIIPGRGIAKRFKEDAYDYPVAEAYLSYTPVDFLNIQFGHGKNFIGDGYRSLLISDVSSPHPYLKFNAKFWKIKYTSTWTWLKDVRREVTEDGAYKSKYMSNHYLSWNVSKRLNVGLFESVLWDNSNGRGFDVNYLNPIIFLRAVEFETGQDAGNALIGLSSKYKWNDNINLYGQFIIDEFAIDDITGGTKSWRNKYGYQIGVKYFDAFKVDNLLLQFEYNRVRPYTYSHNSIVLNFAHNNQSMAHLWGANFSEAIFIGRYHYQRWFADLKFLFGKRGFDFNTEDDMFAYGGDVFTSEDNRPFDTGVKVGQGNSTNIFHAELQGGYLVNPATNLKLFAYLSYRDFDPEANTATTVKDNTLWLSIGLRTDLFNWYFDF